MRIQVLWLLILALVVTTMARAEEPAGEFVRIADPFEVRTRRGKVGWVHRNQLERTLTLAGEKIKLATVTLEAFSERKWELGATGGDFGGAAMLGLYGGYAFSRNLSAELGLAQSFGNISSTWSVTGRAPVTSRSTPRPPSSIRSGPPTR